MSSTCGWLHEWDFRANPWVHQWDFRKGPGSNVNDSFVAMWKSSGRAGEVAA
jgi:hypothetical protein